MTCTHTTQTQIYIWHYHGTRYTSICCNKCLHEDKTPTTWQLTRTIHIPPKPAIFQGKLETSQVNKPTTKNR